MSPSPFKPQSGRCVTLWLGRTGLHAQPTVSGNALPISDAGAWSRTVSAQLDGLLTTALQGATAVAIRLHGSLTAAGVLEGAIAALDDASLRELALQWLVGGQSGWKAVVVRQPDGRHALAGLAPQAACDAIEAALRSRKLSLQSMLPVWAVPLAESGEGRADGRGTLRWVEEAPERLVWTAHREGDSWVRLLGQPEGLEEALSGMDGVVEPAHAAKSWNRPRPAAAVASSAWMLDFAAPARRAITPTGRKLAWAGGLATLAGLWLQWPNPTVEPPPQPQLGAPMDVQPPRWRVPVADAAWTQVQSDLARTWLPGLDRLAAQRPSGIELERMEPISAPTTGTGAGVGAGTENLALRISGRTAKASMLLSWVLMLQKDPYWTEVKVLGWQHDADKSLIRFDVEVHRVARP